MIENLKLLKSDDNYRIIKKQFDILYDYSGYGEEFFSKINKSYFIDPASVKYHGSFKHGLLLHSCNVALATYQNLKDMKDMKVSAYLNNLNDSEFEKYLKEAVFSGLFHDICKVGNYKPEEDLTPKQYSYIINLLKELQIESEIDINNLGKDSGKEFIEKILILKSNMMQSKLDADDFVKELNLLKLIKRSYSYEDNFQIGHGEKSVIILLRMGVQLTDHQIYAIRYHMNEMDVLWQIDNCRNTILIHTDKIPMQKAIILAEKISGFLYEKGKEY